MGNPKAFLTVPRKEAGYRPVQDRIRDFGEVEQTLNSKDRQEQASRCMDCGVPFCHWACPLGNKQPEWQDALYKGKWEEAYKILSTTNDFPEFTGRICPALCEKSCVLNLTIGEPTTCRENERAIIERAFMEGYVPIHSYARNGKKIAVVGSGPAGLAFAGDMAKYGYEVTVFEALHEIGGVLKYGIPEFRLPNIVVDREIEGLRRLGVEFRCDTIIGKTLTVDELQKQGFAGIFVGSGAGLPRFMNIPGENLNGVLSCNEYLTRVNLMGASLPINDTPLLKAKNVMVVGGGNTAMDAVRTAKRLGAERAIVVYRRSEEEMPARVEEVRHAKEEGVEFMTLHNPIEYHADENGRVSEAILQVMTLGEPDESGRRTPIEVEGQTVTLSVDLVIVSVGVSPNPLIPSTVAGLDISKKGTIVVNEHMQSSLPTLFAGGDIVRGGATVILAMSDGRKAAQAMHEYLSKS